MSTTTLLILQSIGIALQALNAGLSAVVHDPAVSLIVSAVIGGYQFFCQHIGNQTTPK